MCLLLVSSFLSNLCVSVLVYLWLLVCVCCLPAVLFFCVHVFFAGFLFAVNLSVCFCLSLCLHVCLSLSVCQNVFLKMSNHTSMIS